MKVMKSLLSGKSTEWKVTASMRLGFGCVSLLVLAVLLGFVLPPYGLSAEELLEDLRNMRIWGRVFLVVGCACGYFSYVIGREAVSDIE